MEKSLVVALKWWTEVARRDRFKNGCCQPLATTFVY